MNARTLLPQSRLDAASPSEIVRAIAAGNLSGLGMLFDRHGADVRRFLRRLGVRASDLDDLVQETFLDVVRASPRFRPDAAVKPWIFGIAAIVARRHRRVIVRALARVKRLTSGRVEIDPPTPAESFELNDAADRARRALDMLSSRKREAFVLVALEGMSGEEASIALGIPIATVWTRLHHARRALKAALAEGDP
jgi:RNA polymerase sigma-70 factor (ECF subfamily)